MSALLGGFETTKKSAADAAGIEATVAREDRSKLAPDKLAALRKDAERGQKPGFALTSLSLGGGDAESILDCRLLSTQLSDAVSHCKSYDMHPLFVNFPVLD